MTMKSKKKKKTMFTPAKNKTLAEIVKIDTVPNAKKSIKIITPLEDSLIKATRKQIVDDKNIDTKIKKYLLKLNDLGYVTDASCSGFSLEHKKTKSDLKPIVSLLFAQDKIDEVYYRLDKALQGTGWQLEYPVSYRVYLDGKMTPHYNNTSDKKMKHQRIFVVYHPDVRDAKKEDAWKVLMKILKKAKNMKYYKDGEI